MERITPSEALEHEYFKSVEHETSLENSTLLLDPKTDTSSGDDEISEFTCPKCGKIFGDLNSCQRHTTSRRHAHFCVYDHSSLPRCINAHAMLPAHPTSGYCDIQGRRQTIEDFHTIHLHPTHQFYGVFDGHLGNLASKFAASSFYHQIKGRLSTIDDDVLRNDESWKETVEQKFNEAFQDSHDQFMQVVRVSPGGVHDQSGTTATILYVTAEAILVANIGDSRAVLSRGGSYSSKERPTAIQLTVDHVARGGHIKTGGGIDRVNGILAVTRTIGDAHLAAVLSRKPHVTALSRSEVRGMCRNPDGNHLSFPCFVVLASDGLWDVMSNQEAVDMVVQVIRKFDSENGITWAEGGAFQEAAQMLTQEAFVRGSMDNIGVCVVAID
jgi:protein phosphatase 1L